MLSFLDQYKFIKGRAAIGVELIFNSKESYTLIAVELIENKGNLEVSKRFVDVTLEEIEAENVKKIPVYFSIGGKGVIHKKVKWNEHLKEQELLNQLLPNASIKDFYLQKSILSEKECWISIIRKDLLDDFIEKIEAVGLFGVKILLGPFVLNNCISLIDQPSILTTTYELLIDNNNIIQLDGLDSVSGGEEYIIEEETVNSHELIAFGTALNHFIPDLKLRHLVNERVKFAKEEYLYKNKYTVIGFSLLILFFLVTVGNMFIGNSYQNTNNELQYQINSKKKYVTQLEKLREELKTKEQFVQNSGVTQASKISYYADQIALSIPKTIRLNQLFVNPLKKRINKAEDIQFNYNTIKITGTVSKSIDLNDWVKEIKSLNWVDSIHIISFIQDNLRIAGEFEIEIEVVN